MYIYLHDTYFKASFGIYRYSVKGHTKDVTIFTNVLLGYHSPKTYRNVEAH